MADTIIEQIRPDLFRAEIPLPRNPLKATNSYIIIGKDRNLIIDTGMSREECKTALLSALDQLAVDLEKTDFFVTHLHADHIGLVDELSADDAIIYFNQLDADILNYKDLWQLVYSLTDRHGFPADQVRPAIESHPGQSYNPAEPIDFKMVSDGEIIRYGGYELQCVFTPGHTSGHTCLYEPHLKYLFSGDHILGDITPNISTWLEDSNPLGEFFKSLDRISAMPVDLVLPGHRTLITNCRKRIGELKEHHRQRISEVRVIMENKGPSSAFEVASHMTWDLIAEHWDDYPLMQKWFATGEALAHICYLEAAGMVKKEIVDQKAVYSISQ